MGLGKHLLREATSFCKRRGYESVFLWTVEALTLAARLYQSAGFVKVEVRPAKQWGVEVIEQKYVLDLGRHVTNIRVEVTNPTSPAARALLAALDEYQLSLYPPESVHLLSAESLSQPNVVFMGAFQNGELVGCGAYVNHDTYGELKRMFVRPDVGGLGIGRRILESLEKHATASRITLLRLETGTAQHHAIRLYENAGYARCGPFGSYTDDHLSVFMQKQLPVSE
jgi:putative acetyltransferase